MLLDGALLRQLKVKISIKVQVSHAIRGVTFLTKSQTANTKTGI